jgi:hypothetical protein
MPAITIHPSTLEGIKRLAKPLKRERRISHSQALDAAAQQAGYASFRHAQKQLAKSPYSPPDARADVALIPIFISAYWRNLQDNTAGRETLLFHAREPWLEQLTAAQLRASRGLAAFRVDAPDHLEVSADSRDQNTARRQVCEAARTLQFMGITGLRPKTGRDDHHADFGHELPQRDHLTVWCHPEANATLIVDEPYHDPLILLQQRTAWGRNHGTRVGATSWPGLYSPGNAPLFLAAIEAHSALLSRVTSLLDAAAPDVPTAEQWSGESAPYAPVFVSPLRAASGRVKRPRPIGKPLGRVQNGAIAYTAFAEGNLWRPNARMPLSAHRLTGSLLKELLEFGRLRSRAHARLRSLRSELDNWLTAEHPDADHRSPYYYGVAERRDTPPLEAIERLESALREHYPDCTPRRGALRGLEVARQDLQGR